MDQRDVRDRPMFAFALDAEGRCIAGDRAAFGVFASEHHEGTDRQLLASIAMEAIETGRTRRVGNVPLVPNGDATFDVTAHPIPAGEGPHALVVVADFSKEESIARVLARYRLLERATHEAYWEWDVASGEVWWNDLHFELLGYDQASTQPSLERWADRVHPDDVDRVLKRFEALLATRDVEYRDEYRYLRADGRVGVIADRGYVQRGADGRPVRVLGTMRDVTDEREAVQHLRESEERFRQIAETIREVFWLTDLESGKVLYVSPAFETIFGRSVAWLHEQPFGYLAAVHPDDRPRVVSLLDRLREGAAYDEVFRIVRPDGDIVWLHDRATPFPTPRGNPRRATGVALDVTAQRKLEERLAFTQRMESMGRLASGIAHDFNNLMGVILGSVELAKANIPTGRGTAQDLEVIRDAASRAVGLTSQLLAFARHQPRAPVTFDLNAHLASLARLLQVLIGDSVVLEQRLAGATLTVRADPSRIEQVVVNLATNARDAMPRGGRLTIETSTIRVGASGAMSDAELPAGDYAVLTVRDTGSGIPDELRDRIFEPFFTTKDPSVGTGLGLAICYGIVRQAGGDVSVRGNEPGEGTTFEVLLPLATVDED